MARVNVQGGTVGFRRLSGLPGCRQQVSEIVALDRGVRSEFDRPALGLERGCPVATRQQRGRELGV